MLPRCLLLVAATFAVVAPAAQADDTSAPTTSIHSYPYGELRERVATIDFTANEPATFTCLIDDRPWEPCASPQTYSGLADGEHTFSVLAIDEAGNVEGMPVTLSWTVDGTASETTLAGPDPGSTQRTRTATLLFVADDDATFECSLDSAVWAPCTSPWRLSGLADGAHVARVRSTDYPGNVEEPQELRWTVDTSTPAPPVPIPAATDGGRPPAPALATDGGAAVRSSAVPPIPSPPPARPRLTGPRRGAAKVDRRGRFTVPGLRVACPAGGRCTVTATTSGGRGAATIAPGANGTVRVTLRRRRLGTVRVLVTAGGPGGTAAATVTVKLR